MGDNEQQVTSTHKIQDFYAAFRKFMRTYPRMSKFLLGVSGFFFLIFLLIASVAMGIWAPMPTKADLQDYSISQASEIYTVDGTLIGRYFLEDRIMVAYDSIPTHLKDALLATEDIRFYQHAGVDGKGLLRVFFKSILFQDEKSGGGSTLSQQIAKNFYPRRNFGWFSLPINKIRESIIARKLERIYSKEEIITLYLNTVSFGGTAFGIESASRRFFNSHTQDLTPEEAALLVGLLKAPTFYNPISHPERAIIRRNIVLNQMGKYEFISHEEVDSLKKLPIILQEGRYTHHQGIAPYFREKLRLELVQWCRENPKGDGTHYNIYKDGLKIYTSLHARLQTYAESAMSQHMGKLQGKFDRHWKRYDKVKSSKGLFQEIQQRSQRYKNLAKQQFTEAQIDSVFQEKVRTRIFTYEGSIDTLISPRDSILHDMYMLHGGFMAVEPQNGFIRAWVGGINHEFYQFDHVKSRRQTGSAFKPLVYATALEEGISPCEYIPNDKVALARYDNWSPKNSDNIYGGEYSMQGALTHSVNIAAVNLILKIGPKKVVELVQKMGLGYELPVVPSLALGSADISLQDMLAMYAVIFNQGKAVKPRYLMRMADKKGQVIFQDPGYYAGDQILRPETSILVSHMLKDVVDHGTARSLRTRHKIPYELAGKTGTTQNQSDGWFIGAAPGLLAGAWVGADDPRIHFRNLSNGQGAATALPIYATFMKKVYEDADYSYLKKERFPRPDKKLQEKMDCKAYWFPLNMTQFKEWYVQEFGEEEEGIR